MVARLVGFPNHFRLVARALASLPDDHDLPAWRVVNARGRTAPNWPDQQLLLEAEGVRFCRPGYVHLESARSPPGAIGRGLFFGEVAFDGREVVGREPADGRIAAEPGQLTLGVAAGVAFDELDGLIARDRSVEPGEQLLVTDGLQGLQVAQRVD